MPFQVIKKGGSRVAFDRQRILNGLLKACEKRPVPLDRIEAVVDNIEREIMETHENEVNSKDIGELVIEALKGLDHVAYVRFASVYREFKDINEFMAELKGLLK